MERLMRLDAALMSADVEWLTTPAEKLAYLGARTSDCPASAARAFSFQQSVCDRRPHVDCSGLDESAHNRKTGQNGITADHFVVTKTQTNRRTVGTTCPR